MIVLPAIELVRAVADRLLAELVDVLVGLVRQRQERHVADLVGEGRVRSGKRDLERRVVHRFQTGELGVLVAVLVLQAVVSLDRREDRGAHLAVGRVGREGPGLRIGLRGDLLAVGELQPAAQRDRVLRCIVVRRDRLRIRVDQFAGVAERHQAFEQLRDDLPSGHIVRVGGNQPCRRLDVVDRDHRLRG